MFDEVLIAGRRATRTKRDAEPYLSFSVRLPWYRSIYLSCLDRIELALDGRPVSANDIFFKLYGTTYRFDELTKHHSVLWFVLDQAEIQVRRPGDVAGSACEIALSLFFRIPYHRASTFRQVSTCTRSLPIEERILL